MPLLDLFRLDGKRALITGGSRGLGRAIAEAFADAGADLVLLGRDAPSLEAARQDLLRFGRRVDTLPGDLSLPSEAERLCQTALASFGPIHILVNNVGGRRLSVPVEDQSLNDWQKLLDLNLTSAFVCCKILGKPMLERRSGSIINISSISGMVVGRGIYGRHYETAKAGLTMFTKTLAVDWAPFNVRVNAICPGGFLTDANRRWFSEKPELHDLFVSQVPMGRLGDPKEIGPLAVYLASEASSYMTGAALVIDGGYTLW